jgi:hypothetical protein
MNIFNSETGVLESHRNRSVQDHELPVRRSKRSRQERVVPRSGPQYSRIALVRKKQIYVVIQKRKQGSSELELFQGRKYQCIRRDTESFKGGRNCNSELDPKERNISVPLWEYAAWYAASIH